jgi:5-formyltetrahydrofolate cyclo-ligase
MSIPEIKSLLRLTVNAKVSALTEEERSREGEAICSKLSSMLTTSRLMIAAYMPLPDEPNIKPLLHELLEKNHALFLPLYKDGTISFHRVTNLKEELKLNRLGINEPHGHLPPLDPSSLDVVIVPGRAFDIAGNRLGRGKGGYDRFIQKQRELSPQTQFWGVAFREQIVDNVPAEMHDQIMDLVITPAPKE